MKHRDKITLVSRRGTNLLPCYPEIGECLKALPDLALDGELVILDEQAGRSYAGDGGRAEGCG